MSRRPVAFGAAALLAGSAQAAPLDFGKVFDPRGEPASLHYHVVYTAGGVAHQLEVWRDGDRRLKRVTDGAITTYAFHNAGDAGYRMVILDLKRRISTRIERTSLYRIGNFTDWFDLGHGLRHPKGTYSLSPAPRADASSGAGKCRWYDLTQTGRTTHVCWDAVNRLPLVMDAADGRALWRVTALDHAPIPTATFVVRDKGFVRNDADQDIAND